MRCMLCGTGEFSDRHFERHCGTQKHRDAVALAKEVQFGCDICESNEKTMKRQRKDRQSFVFKMC